MVRVGGGWVALDEFLVKNDPCRGELDIPKQNLFFDILNINQRQCLKIKRCQEYLIFNQFQSPKQQFKKRRKMVI